MILPYTLDRRMPNRYLGGPCALAACNPVPPGDVRRGPNTECPMEPIERRSQILMHAATLFGERGYHNTSIHDIITAAGVARGTFYLYFANKRNIFEELVDILLMRLSNCIQPVDTDSEEATAREQLLDNMVRILALLSSEPALLSILLKGAVNLDKEIDEKLTDFYAKLRLVIESSLRLGSEIGILRPCDIQLAAQVALGASKEILTGHLDGHPSLTSEEEIRAQASALLDSYAHGVIAQGTRSP